MAGSARRPGSGSTSADRTAIPAAGGVLRAARVALLVACALLAVAPARGQDATGERIRIVSAPDCVDAANIVGELAPVPWNATYMRVQHFGDPGTAELAGQVANPVSWDVGVFSGLSLPTWLRPSTQRGYLDVGPPAAASAFQLACDAAGFHLDSRRFAHSMPVVLGGPNVSIARDFAPAAPVFRSASSVLTLEATIRLPFARVDRAPQIEGTAQLSFMVYLRDTTTGTVLTHVIALYDNRAPGVQGAGGEAVSADAFNVFVSSPLAARTVEGSPTRFVSVGAGSAAMQFGAPWADARLFRARVSYAQFRALLEQVIRERLPHASPRPEDYRVTLFGVLAEIFPGAGGNANEVALSGSLSGLALAEASMPLAPVPAVEYHHAAFDHYFVTAQAREIADLDAGRHAGWRRTGASFLAWTALAEGTQPVCRYYLPPAWGDSHFLSASRDECRQVGERFPGFVREDDAALFVALPDPASGACPADSRPVFRLWNARTDTNHRYTTDAAVRASMLAAGWVSEGYGPQGVAMCTPADATAR